MSYMLSSYSLSVFLKSRLGHLAILHFSNGLVCTCTRAFHGNFILHRVLQNLVGYCNSETPIYENHMKIIKFI